MCTTCGCGDTELVPVELHERILAGNDRTARHNREHFAASGLLAVNLMGSPGAGKTAVLEATAARARRRGWRLAAVSADLATDNDARRLSAAGIPSRAITTGQACHLDAEQVHRSLHGFDLEGARLLFIENVGNLVCPAIYDLGQRANVVVLSIAEGEDKPLKYPVMFRAADLVLITKVDLAGVLGVDLALLEDNLARVMPRPRALRISARSGEGMRDWIAWLDEQRRALERERTGPRAADQHHHHDHDQHHHHDHGHDSAHSPSRARAHTHTPRRKAGATRPKGTAAQRSARATKAKRSAAGRGVSGSDVGRPLPVRSRKGTRPSPGKKR